MYRLPAAKGPVQIPQLVFCAHLSCAPGVGNLFRTVDRFQPGIFLRTGPH